MNTGKLWLIFIVLAIVTFLATFLTAKFQHLAFILVWLLIVAVGLVGQSIKKYEVRTKELAASCRKLFCYNVCLINVASHCSSFSCIKIVVIPVSRALRGSSRCSSSFKITSVSL